MGIPKSRAAQEERHIVKETIVDVYAFLRDFHPSIVRAADEERDCAYVDDRVGEEGVQFLTVQLARLGDWFDKRLLGERVERVMGFKPYDGLNPCFLRPVWIWLSTLNEGSAKDAHLVRLVRTLLHGFKKYEVPWTEEQAQAKISSFKEIEANMHAPVWSKNLQRAQELCEKFVAGYEVTCRAPKHGPGAVAGGERDEEKWEFDVLFESVHAQWPYWEWITPIRSSDYLMLKPASPVKWGRRELGLRLSDRSRNIQLAAFAGKYRRMRREKYPTAKMVLVPKDSRGPRVISEEPKEVMYLQQGVARDLMDYIESHEMTRGHVNFADQTINGKLALESSKTLEFDTIDLSDASDRVSAVLVNYLFPPRVTEKWFALRSHRTFIPATGEYVPLKKFAPMGSALCFPVESLVFWAVCVGAIWNRTNDLALALASVYVYGDDIIVARAHTELVMDELTWAGLKVNRTKSFVGDVEFRESCGVDAWKGYDVTPLRVKKQPPSRPNDGRAIIAWVKYAENSQYVAPRRSKACLECVERVIGRRVPRVASPQSFLAICTELDVWDYSQYSKRRYSRAKGSLIVRARAFELRTRAIDIDGFSRLQRNLVTSYADLRPDLVVVELSTHMVARDHILR